MSAGVSVPATPQTLRGVSLWGQTCSLRRTHLPSRGAAAPQPSPSDSLASALPAATPLCRAACAQLTWRRQWMGLLAHTWDSLEGPSGVTSALGLTEALSQQQHSPTSLSVCLPCSPSCPQPHTLRTPWISFLHTDFLVRACFLEHLTYIISSVVKHNNFDLSLLFNKKSIKAAFMNM